MLIAQVIVNGLLIGGLWALLGLGKDIILGTLRFVNFAHANFALVGMYIVYFGWAAWHVSPFLLLPLAILGLAGLGLLMDRPLVRPLVARGGRAQMLATLAILLVIQNAATLFFGPATKSIITSTNTEGLHLGGLAFVTYTALVTFVLALMIFVATWVILNRTAFGLRVRATAQNREAAIYHGIDIERVYGRAFALSLALAGAVGALYAVSTPVGPTAASDLLILMFVVSILGGLGSTLGCLLGGLVVGVLQGLSALVLPPQLENAVVYMVFLLVVLFRPQGIMGNAVAVREGPF
jgi:branched-chain amino acid transport system permease protein